MKTAEERLEMVDISIAVPLALLLNFSLFQYLVTTFWRRRQERRVRLLLFIAVLSCASLVPFAFPDRELGRNLTDISEVCSVLTFLMQIVILTRDVGKRIKIRSVWAMMWCGEALVVISMVVLILNVIDLFAHVIDFEIVELLDNIVEHVSLVFIVCFRFYFLSIAKGYRKVLVTQKTEILFYLLFLTHEVPFHILDTFTHLNWHHLQGLWMRTTIALCLSMTIKARLASGGSKRGLMTTTKHGPVGTTASMHKSVVDDGDTGGMASVQVRRPSFLRSGAPVVPQSHNS